MKLSILLAQHNIPLSLADHMSPLIRNVFDGEIAGGYACAKTKTSCILNGAVAPEFRAELVSVMQQAPYSLSVDGSNDSGLLKMNPLTVRMFDENRGKVNTRFLDMCTTSGQHAGTAESIFNKMDQVLSLHHIPWDYCVGLGVDNTSVNIGRHNSIMTRIHQKNPNVYIMGCPCHIAHNTASIAAEALQHDVRFDVEEIMVDLFYWFDKSTKRKSSLKEYCCFCDVQYRKIIKHVSTRWLSLEMAIERTLKLYDGLYSYFLSESCSQARFMRLRSAFSSPITEIYLLFYQSVLPVFNRFNLFLQREDPCIHLVHDQCESLLKKILMKFIKPSVIRNATALADVDICTENHLTDPDMFIGFVTRQKLLKLEREGDISSTVSKKFLHGVRQFYVAAVEYIKAKFPIADEVLINAKFIDFEKRGTCHISNVHYFLERFSTSLSLSPTDHDELFDEFAEYQLLNNDDIPETVWVAARERVYIEDSTPTDQIFVRMDVIWEFISSMKTPDHCSLVFPRLSKVAKLVLVLPHSNASEERVFSLVRLNKTSYRSCLALEGTLSSILTIKMHSPEPCFNFNPSNGMLTKAKKATLEYNRAHSSAK